MKLTISGETVEVKEVKSLHDLLTQIGIDTEKNGIAVARNGTVIPKKSWRDEHVNDGDEIEIVRASQGG
jgi:sulfur carrier protein